MDNKKRIKELSLAFKIIVNEFRSVDDTVMSSARKFSIKEGMHSLIKDMDDRHIDSKEAIVKFLNIIKSVELKSAQKKPLKETPSMFSGYDLTGLNLIRNHKAFYPYYEDLRLSLKRDLNKMILDVELKVKPAHAKELIDRCKGFTRIKNIGNLNIMNPRESIIVSINSPNVAFDFEFVLNQDHVPVDINMRSFSYTPLDSSKIKKVTTSEHSPCEFDFKPQALHPSKIAIYSKEAAKSSMKEKFKDTNILFSEINLFPKATKDLDPYYKNLKPMQRSWVNAYILRLTMSSRLDYILEYSFISRRSSDTNFPQRVELNFSVDEVDFKLVYNISKKGKASPVAFI